MYVQFQSSQHNFISSNNICFRIRAECQITCLFLDLSVGHHQVYCKFKLVYVNTTRAEQVHILMVLGTVCLEQQDPTWLCSRMPLHGKNHGSRGRWPLQESDSILLRKNSSGISGHDGGFMTCLSRIVSTPCLHLSVLYFWVNTALILGYSVMAPLLSLILFSALVVKLVEGKVSW